MPPSPHPDPRDQRWRGRLAAGDPEGAWNLFLDEYRGLITATVRKLVREPEERVESFAHVCAALSADGLRRLQRFKLDGKARFSTWLVVVVRNLLVDQYRRNHGRRRRLLHELSPVHRAVFEAIALQGLSYVEAYESLASRGVDTGGFGEFLGIVRNLHRTVSARAGPISRELIGGSPECELPRESHPGSDARLDCERALVLLAAYPVDLRLAILLFVVDDVPADEVARIVGWPGRKAVYNRVSRGLQALRGQLEPRSASNDGGVGRATPPYTPAEWRRSTHDAEGSDAGSA